MSHDLRMMAHPGMRPTQATVVKVKVLRLQDQWDNPSGTPPLTVFQWLKEEGQASLD